VSLYRKPRSPFWHFDFQWRGCRFHGSTKVTTRREAEKVEAAEREKAKLFVAQTEAAKTSLRLDDIAGRYWSEHAQHLAGARNAEVNIALLIAHFGKDKLITDIYDDDVTKLVAWRRGHRARSLEATSKLISSYTVNHTTEQLRKLFTRAKLWGVRFQHEPHWRKHMLPVPSERVREVSEHEADALDAAMRDDYAPFFQFARASGLRLAECLLKWSEVDWAAKQIRKPGKGGRPVTVPITSKIRALLWPLRGHHPETVFTYVCEQGEHGRVNGQRYPITYGGVQTFWRRLRKRSGVVGLRFHDLRHDFATKLLRESGNLRLVQKALGHRNIATTTRYAHVLDSDVAEAMERADAAMERVAKSRAKSRIRLKVV
jgi:integrase